MREIVGAMSRFGFGTLVNRIGLKTYRNPAEAPAPEEEVAVDGSPSLTGDAPSEIAVNPRLRPFPVRFRLLLEELGPTFIKVGQILAGRPDLVPADLIVELERLQDQVAPLPFQTLRPVIEQELGRSLEACYASFDPEPLASASIAQVHAARTLDGDEVVVKVQKPEVGKLLAQDLEIVDTIATLIEAYVPELRHLRPRALVAEFRKALLAETNFTMEAANMKRFRENFATSDFLVVPRVYPDLSGTRVLTQQRLRGVKMSDVEAVTRIGVDPREVLRRGMECFYQSMLIDGFFHGDPHGGNIIVMEDGRLGLIDYGSVGRLSPKAKDALINMFLALLAQDYDQLVIEYLDLSPSADTPHSSTAIAALQSEVGDTFSPFHGLPLKDIPCGKLLLDASRIAFHHRVSLPHDLVLVFKAIMTLEGIGRQLDPHFDLVSAASKYTQLVLRERYSAKRVVKDLLFVGRDLVRFLEKAPRQFGEALRQLENGELQVHLKLDNLDVLARAHARAQSRIALAILSCGLLIAAVFASGNEHIPVWGHLALWVCARCVGFTTFWRSFRRS